MGKLSFGNLESYSPIDGHLRYDFISYKERRWQAQQFLLYVLSVVVANSFII